MLMGQAECTPEPLQPISTPRESNILSSDEIDATEKILLLARLIMRLGTSKGRAE